MKRLELIPKVMHFVWVGDDSKRPDNCIKTWASLNPDFQIRLWGNESLESRSWLLKRHMNEMWETGQMCGVADLMRWEVLLEHGGIALDCDSICLNPLPDWLLQCEAFTCWENELVMPGLLANGYVGMRPNNPLVRYLVENLAQQENIAWRPRRWWSATRKRFSAWKKTGPLAFTQAWKELQYGDLTVLPSHFFIPRHSSGRVYKGSGPVICDQLFAGTAGSALYTEIIDLSEDELRGFALRRIAEAHSHGPEGRI